jgi:hypothetical protein
MERPVPNPPELISARHETRDAAPRPILFFMGSLILTLVAIHLIGWKALRWLQHRQDAANRITFPANPIADAMPTAPPDPRLQPEPSHDVLPEADLAEVQAHEQLLIGDRAWGWSDSTHQFARIPIQEAMNLAVQHGLPNVLPATQPGSQPTGAPASALHGPGGIP